MNESSIATARFTYIHDRKWPSAAIDVHHVIVRQSNLKGLLVCLLAFGFSANGLYLFMVLDKSPFALLWSLLLSSILLKLGIGKSVLKESVMIMPHFGVQLETHYKSGRISRRFVPVSTILKPLLLEHVNPVTSYWVLSLILLKEEELTPVFKELHLPLKMLVPIWKELCGSVSGDNDSSVHSNVEDHEQSV
ncbi:unnamed protein product [Linum trigynum]|uniref:Phosphatidylinositol N-acetylglucosaminyltransferase subunit H conserved domain-containing protein n=1 Tax=Linum trigynum TaxID=586398 RepID=A0AAV2FV53_9ROSI